MTSDDYNLLIGKFVGPRISLSGRGISRNGPKDEQVVCSLTAFLCMSYAHEGVWAGAAPEHSAAGPIVTPAAAAARRRLRTPRTRPFARSSLAEILWRRRWKILLHGDIEPGRGAQREALGFASGQEEAPGQLHRQSRHCDRRQQARCPPAAPPAGAASAEKVRRAQVADLRNCLKWDKKLLCGSAAATRCSLKASYANC